MMNTFIAKDQKNIHYHLWEAEKTEKVLLLVHGMAEHSLRYEPFAKFLNEHQITVLAPDLRGHGQTALDKGKLGHFSDENGWEKVQEDLYGLHQLLEERYGLKEIFLFGHSMGSFISRDYFIRHGEKIEKAVFCGTGLVNLSAVRVEKNLVRLLRKIKGKKAPALLIDKMTFERANRKFKPTKTPSDWISTDEESVQAYIDDPLCGFHCTYQLYMDLLEGMENIYLGYSKDDLEARKKPMLLISGDQDDIGKMGDGVKETLGQYLSSGFDKAQMKLYPGKRHELVNETNRKEVFSDILEFLLQD